jgi:putative transposase
VAIIDWYSRAVLAWRLSNTLHADFENYQKAEAITPALERRAVG